MAKASVVVALAFAFCASALAETAEEKAARREAERAAEEARRAERKAREERVRAHESRIRELEQKLNEKRGERHRKEREYRELSNYAKNSSNDVNRIARNIESLERDLSYIATNSIPGRTRRVAELGARIRGIEQTARMNDRGLQVKKLDNAVEAQRQVMAKMAKLREILATEQPEKIEVAPKSHQENELVTKDAASMDIVEAYEMARQLEGQIIESYKDIKAAQTAISRKMSYESAQKLTDVPKPVRMEADAEALQNVTRTKDALDAKKAEQVKVVREAETMVEATVEMMNEAMEIVMKQGDAHGVRNPSDAKTIKWLTEKDFATAETAEQKQRRLEEMQGEADYQVQITEAAAESEQERAKDVSRLMRSVASGTSPHDGSSAAHSAASAGSTGEDRKPAGVKYAGSVLMPPTLTSADLDVLPGNKITVAGNAGNAPSARWMYVNDWYVIGPFPNPNRENLRRKFPPESVVDLNATYAGKNGERISWKFMQCESSVRNKHNRAHVVPRSGAEYVIWYAYAEVFFDQECDRWIAIGSDDRSDLWINGYPVWGSSNKLKSWNIAEGFRLCHFKKGRNELLIRVENGWHVCDWSVCIALSEGERGGAR